MGIELVLTIDWNNGLVTCGQHNQLTGVDLIRCKLAILTAIALAVLAGTSQAQAHNVGHNKRDRLSQYFYYKANLDHSLTFLAENDRWQLVGHQHNVWKIGTPEITYHRNLARNSRRGILLLIPHRQQWLCIFKYEKGRDRWATNTGNGYFGGIQMDLSFQRAYGGRLLAMKGTANHWTPTEQMIVAEIAYYAGRGFNPWPNTARHCGLI